MGRANGGGRQEKPSHVDRLRWWMGWHGGSRGNVRRMRAGPVVPVGLAWRWRTTGPGSQELTHGGRAGFSGARRSHAKHFLGLTVMRRGGWGNWSRSSCV